MTRSWKYLLFFLLCLVVALVVNLPAGQVLPYLKIPPTVSLSGVKGSVFRGGVQQGSVGQFPLRDVRYRFKPSCLFVLKVCYQVDYAQGTTRVGYDLINGDTELSQTRVEYTAAELAPYLPKLMVQPDGRVELTIEQMTIIAGITAAVNGRLVWRDLGVTAEGTSLNLGDYQVDFSGNPQKYDFKLDDLEADLDVDGEGNIGADGLYRVDVKISSQNTIDPKVKNLLDLFATTISYNNYRVEQSGRLPNNIVRQLFR